MSRTALFLVGFLGLLIAGFSQAKDTLMTDSFTKARAAFDVRVQAAHSVGPKDYLTSPELETRPRYVELKTGNFFAFQASKDRGVLHDAFVDGAGTIIDVGPKQQRQILDGLRKDTPTLMPSNAGLLLKAAGVGTAQALSFKALRARLKFLVRPLRVKQICPMLPEGDGWAIRLKVIVPSSGHGRARARTARTRTARTQTGWLSFLIAADGSTQLEVVSGQGRSGC